MQVYLLRHAESEYNVDPVNNDFIDCSITANGQQQAAALNLEQHAFDLILCSPLRRCRQTLECTTLFQSAARPTIEICPLLREQIKAKCDLLEGEETDAFEEESDDRLRKRVHEFQDYLAALKSNDASTPTKVLIVSHADFLWNLTAHAVNDELFGQWLGNAELMFWKTL